MFEEESSDDRARNYRIIGLISIIIGALLVFFLVKSFFFKPEPSLPKETYPSLAEKVVIKYFEAEQEKNREEVEKYLSSDFSKIELLGYEYKSSLPYWTQLDKKDGSLPKYQVKDVQVQGKESSVIIEMTTNKMEDSLFLDFTLPKKITFDIDLIEEEDQWKIIKIDSPDLILDSKLGRRVEIKKNLFVKPVAIEDYSLKDIEPRKEFKYVSLKVEYENRRAESSGSYFNLFAEWKIVDANQKFYSPILKPGSKEPTTSLPKVAPNEIKKIYVLFEVAKDTSLKELIFQNSDKKVIFKID